MRRGSAMYARVVSLTRRQTTSQLRTSSTVTDQSVLRQIEMTSAHGRLMSGSPLQSRARSSNLVVNVVAVLLTALVSQSAKTQPSPILSPRLGFPRTMLPALSAIEDRPLAEHGSLRCGTCTIATERPSFGLRRSALADSIQRTDHTYVGLFTGLVVGAFAGAAVAEHDRRSCSGEGCTSAAIEMRTFPFVSAGIGALVGGLLGSFR